MRVWVMKLGCILSTLNIVLTACQIVYELMSEIEYESRTQKEKNCQSLCAVKWTL